MFLSRKCLRPAASRRHPAGFNGAGMFLSRKCQRTHHRRRGRGASMGPGCFYPGNDSMDLLAPSVSTSFNGAGMFLSRKCPIATPVNVQLVRLQWGRDVSIPEMPEFVVLRVFELLASMGPGCFYPGNTITELRAVSQ